MDQYRDYFYHVLVVNLLDMHGPIIYSSISAFLHLACAVTSDTKNVMPLYYFQISIRPDQCSYCMLRFTGCIFIQLKDEYNMLAQLHFYNGIRIYLQKYYVLRLFCHCFNPGLSAR